MSGSGRPRPAALAALAALLAALALAAPSQAQTSVKLVGNTGQTASGNNLSSATDRAQLFGTGTSALGYKLTSVKVDMTTGGLTSNFNTLTVQLFHAAAGTGFPTGASLGTFTNPSGTAAGLRTFTAPGAGIDLDPDTSYVFVMDTSQACSVSICNHARQTDADAEDPGAASGWAIDNSALTKDAQGGSWAYTARAMMIELHGYAHPIPAPPPPPVRNTALVDNTSETVHGGETLDHHRAQGFSTGDDSVTLTGVDLMLNVGDSQPNFSVSIYGSQSNGLPDRHNKLVTLTGPGTLKSGVNTFTAVGGFDLTADTDYYVFLEPVARAAGSTWTTTKSNAARVGAKGWGIDFNSFTRDWNTVSWYGNFLGGRRAHRMAVHGYVKNATRPSAPAVTAVTAGAAATAAGSLAVTWSAPAATGGAEIFDYDLRYFAGASDPADEADWVEDGEADGLPGVITATSATVTGLKAGTAYRVQVRAANTVGEGPWSASGSGTTAASTRSGNRAPIVLRSKTADSNGLRCAEDTALSFTAINSPAGTGVSIVLTQPARADWPAACFNADSPPIFHDPDNEELTITVEADLPDNVRSLHAPGEAAYPRTSRDSRPSATTRHRLWNQAASAGGRTDLEVTVTATDPHGATKSITYPFAVSTFPNSVGAPRFDEAVGLLQYAERTAVRTVLPPAAGGDTKGGSVPHYLYKVTGLPPGFKFDSRTRTLSGVASKAGAWTVTYLADDYDAFYSQKDSPTAADTADSVTQTFTIRVVPQAAVKPEIKLVRIASLPTHDSDSDGIFDTYVLGDTILVDVEYSEPVEITGEYDNVRLRLDLGPDTAQGGNNDAQQRGANRKVAKLQSVRNGGRTLRFAYTVASGVVDTDGVWVQTNASDQALFLAGTPKASIAGADTGIGADITAGLPTSGGELLDLFGNVARAKVNGNVTAAAGPVPQAAAINGNTVTVTFTKPLDTNVDKDALMYRLSVFGAGDVSGGNRNAYQHPGGPGAISIANEADSGGVTRGKLTFTLDTPARAGNKVTLAYADGGRLLKGTDAASSPVPGFQEFPVANQTPGNALAGPEPLRASAAGNTVKVVFDHDLDESSRPAGSAFTVRAEDNNLNSRTLPGTGTAAVSGATVTIKLAQAIEADESVIVSYAKPASGMLKDALHHTEAASFGGFRVETVADVAGPTLINAIYIDHPTISTFSSWTLYFDEALDPNSVPAAADFEVRHTSNVGSILSISSLAVANNAITFDAAARPAAMWFKYTPPATGGIRDLAGNAAAKIDGTTKNKAHASAIGKPVILSDRLSIDGAFLSIPTSSLLDPTSAPDPSAFTLHDTDTANTQLFTGVEAVLLEQDTARLRLAHPVHPCAGATPIRVKYTKPAGASDAKLRGLDGTSEADTFGPYNVTNARSSQCVASRNWVNGMQRGSVVIRANRPFATDREAPQPEWFSVTASGGPVTVTEAAFDPNDAHVLKLELSREFAAGETVTASYQRPQGALGLWDVDGYQLGDVADWPVRAKAQAAEPTLTVAAASAEEGETLAFTVTLDKASTAEVTVDYATADGTALAGEDYEAASGTLTFAAGETEKTVSVQTLADTVTEGDETFTLTLSNASGAEIAETEATGTVNDVPPPLTAEFVGLPSGHDGSRRFAFEIVFSEEFEGLRLTAFGAGALEVANGRLIDAKRTVRGENRSVTLRARPDSDEPVTLTLKETTDCAAADAICASDGRPLSAAVSATVAGPGAALPALSVADATAAEGGPLSFAVTLDAASDADATVDWATSDGTATAGSDYTAASGTLTFAAGETAKTVTVAALHDAEAETDETFAVTLSNATGATLGDAQATGTVAEVAPLTASLAGVPAEHDGTNAFSFELAFGDDFAGAMAGAALAGAFAVGNGTATGATRIVAGQNRRWTVTVQPSSTGAVTVSLAAGTVTTEAGRPLANAVSATVAAPALLSVADAEADEGKALSFAVTLDRAASGTVTVDWATADGTATAGTDYTSASGALTFSAGETTKTVTVQALTDSSAEDDETFTLNLSNAVGAAVEDGQATGTVIDVPPLTASFANLPPEHDGSHRFGFEIVFSEEFDGMRLTAFAAGALQVAGGRLIDAKRAVRGQNRRVAVRVRPDSNADLTLTLASAADCNAAHAVCANDGRMLSNTVTATVRGPALVSVADVEATEGEDENVVFTVSLNRAAAGTATVDYATADRTAHAGEDYTATSGTLAFAPGETSKTVSVPLLDDAIDDDGETFALELNNAQGAALGDRVGLATIHNSDPVPKAWLVRFSRAATDHAVDAVQRRFDDRGAESHATLGGHRLWGPGSLFNRPAGTVRGEFHGASGTVPGEFDHAAGTFPGKLHGAAGAVPGREGILPSTRGVGIPRSTGRAGTLSSSGGEGILPSQAPEGRHARHGGSPSAFGHTPTLQDLLQGSSFLLSLTNEEEAATPRRLTTWGNAATTRFDGLDGNVSVDGEVATYLLGADLEWNRWLAGVALAHSVGHGGFQADTPGHKSGELDSSLTAMHPYLRWRASDRVSAWGMLGYGTGTLDLVIDETKPGWTTDTSMRMAAAGMRGVLSRTGGTELAAKLDARLSHIASESAESASGLLGDTAGGTSRLRLALEGSRAFAVGASRMLTPTLDLGLRHDGGDAETGAGVDLGGTLRYADAHLGLTAEASGRWLLAHEDAAYREWGASATVRVDPGTANRGLSLSLQPSWGASATGGADRLWSLQDARALASGGYGMDEGMRLDADVGWAFDWFRGKGAMRPFLGMRTAGPSRDWRAGVAWHRGQHLEFGFEASRRDSPAQPPDHGIELRLEWRPAQGTAFRAVPPTPEHPPPTPAEPPEAPPEG